MFIDTCELCEGEPGRGQGEGGNEGHGGKTRLSTSVEAKLDPDSWLDS